MAVSNSAKDFSRGGSQNPMNSIQKQALKTHDYVQIKYRKLAHENPFAP